MAQPPILRIDQLSKRFPRTPHPAVNQVTLALPQGDLLALLGPSGCGKTTLLRMIAGFDQPDSGTIELAGQRVAGQGSQVAPEQRAIGMVFQDFALFPHLTVAQNVAFGLQTPKGGAINSAETRDRTAEVIRLVGLEGFEARYPHELSGGQQQRVALARALAPRPALILLDEPFSNLDVYVRSHLRNEVRHILRETGTSGIFVTHDQEEALSISDWVAVMRQGCLEQFGPPERIYQEPVSRFVAEFVTQANFLPAQRRGEVWETEVGSFRCGGEAPQEQGTLMIRQEDLILEPCEDASVIVRDRLFLGRELCYCLLSPSGRELHARTTAATQLAVGTRVQLSVASRSLRVFPAA